MIPPLSSKYIGVGMEQDFQVWVSVLDCSIFEFKGLVGDVETTQNFVMTQEQRTQLETLLKSFTEE